MRKVRFYIDYWVDNEPTDTEDDILDKASKELENDIDRGWFYLDNIVYADGEEE
jgi:hypothetical protein